MQYFKYQGFSHSCLTTLFLSGAVTQVDTVLKHDIIIIIKIRKAQARTAVNCTETLTICDFDLEKKKKTI